MGTLGYKYYYTLQEVLGPYNTTWSSLKFDGGSTPSLADIVTAYYGIPTAPIWITLNSGRYALLLDYVKDMFNRDGVYFWVSDTEYDVTVRSEFDELQNEAAKKIEEFIDEFAITKDPYIGLIQGQNVLKNSATNDLQETVENWTNNTPQTTGTYTTEDYSNTYTKQKRTSPIGTVTDKLEQIDNVNKDYYADWARHFRKFIIVGD